MTKEITVTLTDKSHKHAEMMIHVIANPCLCIFAKTNGGKWDYQILNSIAALFATHREHFLCHPNHTEECLHWLNGGHVEIYCKDSNQYLTISQTLKGWKAESVFMNPEANIRIKQEPEYVKFEGDANDAYRAMLDGETLYSGDNKCPWYFDGTQFIAELGDTIPETIRYIHGPEQLYRKVEQEE